MTEPAMSPGDPLEQFLHPRPGGDESPPWRANLLDQTVKVLRRRRYKRRLASLVGLAACFVAGLAARDFWPAPQLENSPIVRVHVPEVKDEPPVAPQVQPPISPLALEWQAFDSTKDRAALYRQAGDRYLQELQDFASALRCYSQALDASSETELAIAPEDNWLVMALKDARRKERTDAEVNR